MGMKWMEELRAAGRKTAAWMRLDGGEQKLFYLLCGLYVLYMLPLLLAGDYYLDDLGRSDRGYFGWSRNGRPLADGVLMFLGFFGRTLQDIGPLPQLVALVLLAYTMVLLSRRFYAPLKRSLLAGCLGLAIMSPFLLQNFVFRFDSAGMFLALVLAMLGYAVPEELSQRYRFVYTVITLFLMLNIYQAAIGVFVAMAFLELLFGGASKQAAFRRLVERAATLIVAGILYKVFLLWVPMETYAAAHSALIQPWTAEGQQILRANVVHIVKEIGHGFLSLTYVPFALSGLLFLAGAWNFFKKGMLLRYLLAFCGMAASLFIIFPFFKEAVLQPRVMMPVVVVFLCFGVLLSRFLQQGKKLANVVLVLLLLAGIDFSYAFANVMHRQMEYDVMIAREVISDTGALDPDREKKEFVFLGNSPLCREFQLTGKVRPFVRNLTSIYTTKYWSHSLLRHVSNRDLSPRLETEHDHEVVATKSPIFRRDVYDIYTDNDTFIIQFHDR